MLTRQNKQSLQCDFVTLGSTPRNELLYLPVGWEGGAQGGEGVARGRRGQPLCSPSRPTQGAGRTCACTAWSQKPRQGTCHLPWPIREPSEREGRSNNSLYQDNLQKVKWFQCRLSKRRAFQTMPLSKTTRSHLMGSLLPGSQKQQSTFCTDAAQGLGYFENSSIDKDTSRTFFGKTFRTSFNI